jgi:hypothetical protein
MRNKNHIKTASTAPNETPNPLVQVIIWLKSLFHRLFHWIMQFGHKSHHNEIEEQDAVEVELEDETDMPELGEHGDSALDMTTLLVLKRIRLRARRRISWLRHLWHESTETKEAHNYHTEVDALLDNKDTPEAEYHWVSHKKRLIGLNEAIEHIETNLYDDKRSCLAILNRIFNLTKEENDLIQACLGLSVEPNLGKIYAYLQDNQTRAYPTEELVARLFGHGYSLALSAQSPLKAWSLIQEKDMGKGEPPCLICDPYIRNWLLGISNLDKSLVGIAKVQDARKPLSNWQIQEAVDFFVHTLNDGIHQPVRFFVAGAEGTGRRTLSACIAQALGLPLLTINSDSIVEQDWQQTFMRAQRQACLDGFALAWTGQAILNHAWKNTQPAPSIQFIIGEVDEFMPNTEGVLDYRIEMPPIPLAERIRLWQTYVPAAKMWAEKDLEALAQRHQSATIGQIIQVGERGIASIVDASEALRASHRRRLGNLAQQLDCPFSWDDLIVPDWLVKNLKDFTFEATERVLLWEQPEAKRLFPQGKGLMALLTGPPGTGKTMAAQVIAAELDLDLYRIDLSSVVSKYVGETSKNIERILSRAQKMDAVLLFDEADSLFGKRTDIKDAHDRFANTDTNYLLQAIEQYPGIAILTSNKKANIDTGFTRRLRYVIDFSKPTVAERLKLWQSIIGELAGKERLDVLNPHLWTLAEALELTGAQIKFAILSGIFMARQNKELLALPHLIAGVERELIKENRGISRQLQEILLKR